MKSRHTGLLPQNSAPRPAPPVARGFFAMPDASDRNSRPALKCPTRWHVVMRGTITCARRGFPHARSQPSRAGAQRRLGSSHRQDRGSGGSPSASSRRSFRASNSPIGTRRGGSTKCPCCAHRAPNPRPPVGCTTGNCLAGSTRVRGSHCARETPTPPAVALRIPLRPALSPAATAGNRDVAHAARWSCRGSYA